jgi:hypothetical protein
VDQSELEEQIRTLVTEHLDLATLVLEARA